MKILFLCVGNSARSQIAEGLAKEIFSNPMDEVFSAGSAPATGVNPFAVQVLSEIGIDISNNRPKFWDKLPPTAFINLDFVITLCAEEVCPTVTVKTTKLHWALSDPAAVKGTAEERLRVFRNTRDEIKRRLEEFKKEVKVTQKSTF